jgi:hypothetical protein
MTPFSFITSPQALYFQFIIVSAFIPLSSVCPSSCSASILVAGKSKQTEIKSKGEREDLHLTGQKYAQNGSLAPFCMLSHQEKREYKNHMQAGKKRESKL